MDTRWTISKITTVSQITMLMPTAAAAIRISTVVAVICSQKILSVSAKVGRYRTPDIGAKSLLTLKALLHIVADGLLRKRKFLVI